MRLRRATRSPTTTGLILPAACHPHCGTTCTRSRAPHGPLTQQITKPCGCSRAPLPPCGGRQLRRSRACRRAASTLQRRGDTSLTGASSLTPVSASAVRVSSLTASTGTTRPRRSSPCATSRLAAITEHEFAESPKGSRSSHDIGDGPVLPGRERTSKGPFRPCARSNPHTCAVSGGCLFEQPDRDRGLATDKTHATA